MIRVLHELSSLDGGGVSKLLFDYYSNMDHEKIHFDFMIYDYYEEGIFEAPLKAMGCEVYRLPVFKIDKKQCLQQMETIIKNGHYDVVHSHRGSRALFVLHYARKYGVKKRIAHSHIAYEPVSKKKRFLNIVLSKYVMLLATDLFACGIDAGIYMWGKKTSDANRIRIMKNAIKIDQYKFSEENRAKARQELGLTNELTFGIVGRISDQKNFPFLIKTYSEVQRQIDNSVLIIIGRGVQEEEDRIIKMCKEIGITEKVHFLGVRNDVPFILNALDVFVLPSLYEGLPVVLIEEQANGLPAVISERITDEMVVTDLIQRISIDGEDAPHIWANALIATEGRDSKHRSVYSEIVKEAGYDIITESKKMQEFYLQ